VSRSELVFIEEAKNGSKTAFEALFQKHQKYIYNLLFQLTGDPARSAGFQLCRDQRDTWNFIECSENPDTSWKTCISESFHQKWMQRIGG